MMDAAEQDQVVERPQPIGVLGEGGIVPGTTRLRAPDMCHFADPGIMWNQVCQAAWV